MNENEKPLSDFILSPSQWDGTTKLLVGINILFFGIIIFGILLLIGGFAQPFVTWLMTSFGL